MPSLSACLPSGTTTVRAARQCVRHAFLAGGRLPLDPGPAGAAAGAGTSSLAIITALCLAVYIVSFAFSLGPIVWLMISEIYPLGIRAQAMAVSTASNWGANFLVSFSFPVMAGRLGSTVTFFHLRRLRAGSSGLHHDEGAGDQGQDVGGDQQALALRRA